MTNSILKRLATKGFLTMRKVNRNIHYLVTAEGIDLIARRNRYLRSRGAMVRGERGVWGSMWREARGSSPGE